MRPWAGRAGGEGARLLEMVVACSVLREEISRVNRRGLMCEFLEFGYHRTPGKLAELLQERINAARGIRRVLLGYGLCSKGVLGIVANACSVIVPRVHDCISLLLGSRQAYDEYTAAYPGTFFVSKGWLHCGGDPLSEFEMYRSKYGDEDSLWCVRELFKNYQRLCFICSVPDDPFVLARAREVAKFMGWQYEERQTTLDYVDRLVNGPWHQDEFVVLEPGEKLTQAAFL